MKNKELGRDYFERAEKRMMAVKALVEVQSWADVVRESQEVVELALKGLLRAWHIDVPPKVHDVSEILIDHKETLPKGVRVNLEKLAEISRALRRDRELAFYGSDDITPSQFYVKKDAYKALSDSEYVLKNIKGYV